MSLQYAIDFIWEWLEKIPMGQWKNWIDHDGDMGRGFHVFNENWGHVANNPYAFLAAQPMYAWIGK